MKTLVLITSLLFTLPAYLVASPCFEDPTFNEVVELCTDYNDSAEEILGKVEQKFNSISSMQADFTLRMENLKANIDESQTGSIFLDRVSGNYRLETDEIVMITSQEKESVHTILLNEGETTVDIFDADESEFSPVKLYTLYKNDYKPELKPDQNLDGTAHAVIDLTPKNTEKSPYHKIRLYVNRNTFLITKGVVFEKNGTDYTYKLTNFKQNPDLSSNIFNYTTREFPGFEIIDLR